MVQLAVAIPHCGRDSSKTQTRAVLVKKQYKAGRNLCLYALSIYLTYFLMN